jgi:hypothetical protein
MELNVENMSELLDIHECENLEEFSNLVYENTEGNLVVGYISHNYIPLTSDHEKIEEVKAIYFVKNNSTVTHPLVFPFELEKFNQTLENE